MVGKSVSVVSDIDTDVIIRIDVWKAGINKNRWLESRYQLYMISIPMLSLESLFGKTVSLGIDIGNSLMIPYLSHPSNVKL